MKRYLPEEIVSGGFTSDVLEILNLEAEEVPLHEVIFRLVEEVLDEQLASEDNIEKPEIEPAEEELDEVTTMGGAGGGNGGVEISGGKGGGPFSRFDPKKENEDERKRSKTNENKDLVEETLNYLLNVIN